MTDDEKCQRVVDISRQIVAETGELGGIAIAVNERGGVYINFHGLRHKEAVLALANAIHAVLGHHDQCVLAGDAGPELQRMMIDAMRGGQTAQ